MQGRTSLWYKVLITRQLWETKQMHYQRESEFIRSLLGSCG